MAETNGRVRLSWAQIVWGIATLSALIGSWYDTRSQIGLLRAQVGFMTQQWDKDQRQIWKAIDEARAAPAPVESKRR